MGTCKFCGNSAGLFRSVHRECQEKYDAAWTECTQLAHLAARGDLDAEGLNAALEVVGVRGRLDPTRREEAKVVGWERAVNHFLDDGQLSADEETHLMRYQEYFALPQDTLDRNGAYSRLVKAGVLRDVMEGRVPRRLNMDIQLPFAFQKGETVIWLFTDTEYYEDRVKRQYVGGSHGLSFRIAKGVYYRFGAFRGAPVETSQRVHVDTGFLAVTTKHLYFAGGSKSLRLRHEKIISLIPFDDGVGIHRDAASAKPQIFVTGDGWFTYNLLANVASIG